MAHRELLTTKNTFLDCPSPWTEPVELPQRPSSDPAVSTPGASTDGGSALTDQTESSVDRPCAAGPREPSGASREGAAFVPMSKTKRRAKQRRDAKEIKARVARSDSSVASSASTGPQPSATECLSLREAVDAAKLETSGGASPCAKATTKLSL